jgi:hypothetical protein
VQKIDKSEKSILSVKYYSWLKKMADKSKSTDGTYRYYYDDVVMNLYKCQKGVCAYTEMYICVPELYHENMWSHGRYKHQDVLANRNNHLGELDHFDPKDKKENFWNWDNLFMIHAKINALKSNNHVYGFLKPDIQDYSPNNFFDYDLNTHRFIPKICIKDVGLKNQISYMIDNVLFLNHGVVLAERRNFINSLLLSKNLGLSYKVDRFFTAVEWCI